MARSVSRREPGKPVVEARAHQPEAPARDVACDRHSLERQSSCGGLFGILQTGQIALKMIFAASLRSRSSIGIDDGN